MKAKIEFKPQDCWIGVFWKKRKKYDAEIYYRTKAIRKKERLDVWICIVPMLPIHLVFEKE